MIINLLQVDNLPAPHGQCDEDQKLSYYDVYTKQNCIKEGKQRFLQEKCGCRYTDMRDRDQGK